MFLHGTNNNSSTDCLSIKLPLVWLCISTTNVSATFNVDTIGLNGLPMGSKIKYYRLQKQLQQKELAQISGIEVHAIRKYENNKVEFKCVSLSYIQAIANALDVDWKDISDDYYIFINSDYGEQILKYRKDNNLTQTQLGEILGVRECAVRLWEHNKNKPPRKLWELMSK